MKKILLKSSIIVATLVVLSGCGAPPKPPQIIQTNDTKSIQQKYNYVDNLQSTKITKDMIMRSIYKNMRASSSISDLSRRRFNSECSDYYGKQINKNPDNIEINYYRGRGCWKDLKHKKGGLTYLTLTIPIKLTEKNNEFNLVSTFPKNYTYREATFFGGAQKPVAPTNELLADTKKMFSSLSKPISFSNYIEVKSDINTEYSTSSIYANFERKLKKYNWSTSNKNKESTLVKENAFSLTYKGKSYPLSVKVYPYKNGSKVTYTIGVNYIINPDGTTSIKLDSSNNFNPKFSTINTKDFEAMKNMVVKIVND